MSLNKAYKDPNLDLNFFRTQGLLNHPHIKLDTILALMNAHVRYQPRCHLWQLLAPRTTATTSPTTATAVSPTTATTVGRVGDSVEPHH